MTLDQLETIIVDMLKVNANVDWDTAEITPNEEFDYLVKETRDLFKEFRKEKIKWQTEK